ncbi:MAG: hypothetical protein M3309_07315 [Actinomycetota bacterium]|nr:hypothetical protein [Actinomycetota bacterium]
MKNRDVASTLMGLTVAWNMYGFATNFFERAWRDTPIPVTPIAYALNAAIAIFAPLTRAGKRWISLTSTVLGVLMAVWSAIGVLFMSDRETQMAPGMPGAAGPGVAAVLGAMIAVFGRRAYGEKEPRLDAKRWSPFR